jgi:formylglycine-generating enzyme required for sulfatase activity
LGAAFILLLVQHVYVAMHRYPDGLVEVPADYYRSQNEDSPLLSVLRGITNVDNLELLIASPPSEATLPGFFLDRTEVTNADYRRFLSDQKTNAPPDPKAWSDARYNDPNQPVVTVDWAEADAFCRSRGKRLPTSDEWEHAARGAHGRLYPWGDRFEPRAANTKEGPLPGPVAVGTLPRDRTPEGIMDMAGNVSEWTSDLAPAQGSHTARYVKGASFNSRGDVYALGYLSIPADVGVREALIGFRCAADAEGKSAPTAGMLLIPGGSFVKGSEDQALLNLARKFGVGGRLFASLIARRPDQGNQPAFGLDRTEVTNAAYAKFLGAAEGRAAGSPAMPAEKTSHEPDAVTWHDPRFNQADQPVVNVDWYDADAFCRWRGLRLPTSKEWERAAAGPSGRRYPWGDQYEANRCATRDSQRLSSQTSPVGSYPGCITTSGIADLVGNADEWTSTVGHSADIRILRGGSWAENGEIRGISWLEQEGSAMYRGPDVGFRCASDRARSWIERLLHSQE